VTDAEILDALDALASVGLDRSVWRSANGEWHWYQNGNGWIPCKNIREALTLAIEQKKEQNK